MSESGPFLARHATGPEQARRAVEASDDCGFDADLGRAGIEDGVDAPVEIGQDMSGTGGADTARAVRRGRCDRPPGRFQNGMRDRMGGDAQRHGGKARPCQVAHRAAWRRRDDQRQRTRPEGLRQRQRIGVEQALPPRAHEIG